MKPVKLDRYVDAYRDACCAPLDDTALKRRINRTLRERAATNRQRPWIWLFGLGGMLTASLASATPAGQVVIAWLQRQLPNLEARYEVPEPHEHAAVTTNDTTKKARIVADKPREVLPEVVESIAAIPDLAAVPASLNDGAEPRVNTPARTSVRAPLPANSVKASLPAIPNVDTALYERAFQLQFTHGNYPGALSAWDSYLAAAKAGGALVGEARFHRAVCLVAMGRYSEARTALTKIANGAGGAAYQARAHTLLQALESAER